MIINLVSYFIGFGCAAILFTYLAWILHRRWVVRYVTVNTNDRIGDALEKRRETTDSGRRYAVRVNAGMAAKESNLFPVRNGSTRKNQRNRLT